MYLPFSIIVLEQTINLEQRREAKVMWQETTHFTRVLKANKERQRTSSFWMQPFCSLYSLQYKWHCNQSSAIMHLTDDKSQHDRIRIKISPPSGRWDWNESQEITPSPPPSSMNILPNHFHTPCNLSKGSQLVKWNWGICSSEMIPTSPERALSLNKSSYLVSLPRLWIFSVMKQNILSRNNFKGAWLLIL